MSPPALACLFARESGLRTLDALEADGRYPLACLVTHAFEPDGKTPRPEFPRYQERARKLGVPLYTAERDRKDLRELKALRFGFLVSVCYKYILPEDVLALPSIAALNMHRSLLPKYPGLKPLEKALAAGEKEVGLTIHRMVAEVDSGKTLGQVRVPVEPGDTVATLFEKIYPLHGPLLLSTLDRLASATPAWRAA